MTKHRRKEFPCVLCDEPTYDWDHLCRGCRNDHKLGARVRKARERKDAEAHAERVPIIWYWKLFFPRNAKQRDRSSVEKDIREAVVWLANGEKAGGYSGPRHYGQKQTQVGNSPYSKDYDGSFDIYEFSRRGTWKHLLDLCKAIADFGQYWYIDGFKNGSRLLTRLADGEVSVEEYNDRMARRISG